MSVLASLTIVPSMAVVVVNIETRFFDRYHKSYGEIAGHATRRASQFSCRSCAPSSWAPGLWQSCRRFLDVARVPDDRPFRPVVPVRDRIGQRAARSI
jgi:hypothetical protein